MDAKFLRYNEKRNFAVTNEPEGRESEGSGKPRFSVQHHIARNDHFDLRLEFNGVAVSWAVPKGPSYKTSDKRLAMRVEDHPIDYMDFEGVIPKGEYGGGTVMLWDEGVWTPLGDPEKGLKVGSLKFRLDGERLKGNWALVRMKDKESGEPWLLIKEEDEYAKNVAGVAKYKTGVRSGKTMEGIAEDGRKNPFDTLDVMLAKLCDEPPKGGEWLYEMKFDGYRVTAFCEDKVVLKTRNGNDCTKTFKVVSAALEKALGGRSAVIDGEAVVAGEDGISDFSALQSYIKYNKKEGLCYMAFDLLALDGVDLRDRPIEERKLKLKELLKGAPPAVGYSEHIQRMTKRQLAALKGQGAEGVVIKRMGSPYRAGKNGDWLKLKFRNESEFAIGGYTAGEDGGLKSLLVGHYDGGELVFAGSVGTGFGDVERRELKDILGKIKTQSCPFVGVPKGHSKGAVWTKPELVAQVEYAEITPSGLLRQASFKGLRDDKQPLEVIRETPSQKIKTPSKPAKKATSEKIGGTRINGIQITHPEKIMFPEAGVTKMQLAEYYAAAALRMLPHVKDRLLSLVCCPGGVDKETFFRRHLDGTIQGVKTQPSEDGEYFYISDMRGLLSLVQYNAVEFHVRGNKKGTDRPDVMVFDLDPDEGLGLDEVRWGVKDVKGVLDELGLTGFLKTSGGKGYHILVPFKSGADPDQFKDFSRTVAELLEARFPDRYTSSISKKQRKGRIFIDWQRNSPAATSAAAYSVRARKGATVSFPIAWEELGSVPPSGIDIKCALSMLKQSDPWADYFEVKKTQNLNSAPRK